MCGAAACLQTSMADMARMFTSVLKTERVRSTLVGQVSIAREVVMATENLSSLLPALAQKMNMPQQQVCLVCSGCRCR